MLNCNANTTLCLNGGTCYMISASQYECACPAGFQGNNCENSLQTCYTNPCLNGGICITNINSSISCICRGILNTYQ